MRRTTKTIRLNSARRMGLGAAFVILLIIPAAFVTSCAMVSEGLKAGLTTGVTTYGKPPVADPETADRYIFKVYYGKLGTRSNADACAIEAIEKFKISRGYLAYEIIDFKKHIVPSYYLYTVAFSR